MVMSPVKALTARSRMTFRTKSAGLMGFRATVLTLYPEMFPGTIWAMSLAGRALERGDAVGRGGQYPGLRHRQAPQCR
jgi:uncharacterized alpha-E superfamily protein